MIIKQICRRQPDGCQVHGFLYEADSPLEQSEDMLEVVLPKNDILVCAGWFPDRDPNGSYKVLVSQKYTELAEIDADNVEEAADLVDKYVKRHYYENNRS